VDAVELGGEAPPDVRILSIECFLEGLFGVTKSLGFAFVGLDIGCKVVQFLLSENIGTSTAASRFLSDIDEYIIDYQYEHSPVSLFKVESRSLRIPFPHAANMEVGNGIIAIKDKDKAYLCE
jgi:hypothetical protein